MRSRTGSNHRFSLSFVLRFSRRLPLQLHSAFQFLHFVYLLSRWMRSARKNLKRLSRQEFTYKEEPSLAAATAVMITLIGLVAIILLMIGGAGR